MFLAPFLSLALHAGAPDVLLIVADDLGVADLESVAHPFLDALAERGVTYTAAYANPLCVPTRRSLYFGRSFARESGAVCQDVGGDPPALDEVSLAELAGGRQTALFGKWHVGRNPSGPWQTAPQAHGFDVWRAGTPMNLLHCLDPLIQGSYTTWLRVDDGHERIERRYNPLVVLEEATGWWTATRGPKLAVVAPALTHGPFHAPPSFFLPPGYAVGPTMRERYEAMIVALDTFVGVLLQDVDLERTVVVFIGDNGTPPQVSPLPLRSKGTTFERGIHVPLIVAGPGFAKGTTSARLTHAVDVYATIADVLGAPAPAGSVGRSLLAERTHDAIVCAAVGVGDACARSATLKLRRTAAGEELYDLVEDPDETNDVLGAPHYAADEERLRAVLDEFEAEQRRVRSTARGRFRAAPSRKTAASRDD
jgi:hypothetical protein